MTEATLDNKFYLSFDDTNFIETCRLMDERDKQMNTQVGMSRVWVVSMDLLQEGDKSSIPKRKIVERGELEGKGAEFIKH